jgi:hypothetical protein
MDELNEGKRKWWRRSREEIAVLLAGLRESGQTQQAYAKQVGVSLSSIGRWVRGNGLIASGQSTGTGAHCLPVRNVRLLLGVDVRICSEGMKTNKTVDTTHTKIHGYTKWSYVFFDTHPITPAFV